MAVVLEALLEPIAADRPCGDNLEDTPLLASFDAHRLFGQSRSPEAPPDADGEDRERERARAVPEWGQLKADALSALAQSKDLRLLAYLGAAVLRTDGLPAFFETLTVASRWLEGYWPHLFPVIDEDAIARRNALNCLADPMAVVDRVWRAPLVESRQHGRFGLRDIDISTGFTTPGPGDVRPEPAAIAAAFAELPLDTLTTLSSATNAAIEALKIIDEKMRAEGGPEVAPSFEVLSAHLARMGRALGVHLASRVETVAGDETGTGTSEPGVVASGPIRSRQDAIRALDSVAEFFRRNEPSSPVPLFIDRAKRLVAKDFLEVLADIAPDALSVARAAGGLKAEEQG